MINTLRDLKYIYEPISNLDVDQLSPFIRAIKCRNYTSLENYISTLKTKILEDGIIFACMLDRSDVAKILIDRGVNYCPVRTFDVFSCAFCERFTVMGHAIYYRQIDLVKLLLSKGMDVDNVYYSNTYPNNALDVYYCLYNYKPMYELLKLLLENKSNIKGISKETIFMVGTKASSNELKLLLHYGLDAKSVLFDETKPELKGKDTVWYNHEVTLFDLVIMNAEKENIFGKNNDSIEKVYILLNAGVNYLSTKNFCSWTYLHILTIPEIIEKLCEMGVPVSSEALSFKFSKEIIRPLDIALDPKVINILEKYGATRSNPSNIEIDQSQKLYSAYRGRSIKKFVHLLMSDKDCVDQTGESGWNILHKLFADYSHDSISEIYDFIDLAESHELRLINMLIKYTNAKPLKDKIGRTPIMCMTFHPFAKLVTKVIQTYSNFEADYYKLDRNEYINKIFALRNGGFKDVETIFSSVSVPIKHVFDEFWASFINHRQFNPKTSHDPISSWNRMRDILG